MAKTGTSENAALGAWRRHLGRVTRLAVRIEATYAGTPLRQHEAALTYAHVVMQRRLAQSVLNLRGYEHEAGILIRTMMEASATVEWIRLRSPERRARRFFRYRAVAITNLLEQIPKKWRPPDHEDLIRPHLRQRARTKHLFLNRNPKGRLVWDKHWARNGSKLLSKLEDRIYDAASGKERAEVEHDKRTRWYWMYRQLSSRVHADANAFEDVVETRPTGGFAPIEQFTYHQRRSPLTMGSICLIGALEAAVEVFAGAYRAEVSALRQENDRIATVHDVEEK